VRGLTLLFVRLLSAVALLAITLMPGSMPATAQAQGRAGLVVVHGDGRQAFAIVEFEGESIRAVDLLDRTGLEVTEVGFGALGVAICDIDGSGCDVATCRRRVCQGPRADDPFWQLFIRTSAGAWQRAPLGISSDTLIDGDVRALIWTGTEPVVPVYSIDDVAARAGTINGEGVALTRYNVEGEIVSGASGDESGVPLAGVAVVALAALLATTLVIRRQISAR
jgi:hypothetical protein